MIICCKLLDQGSNPTISDLVLINNVLHIVIVDTNIDSSCRSNESYIYNRYEHICHQQKNNHQDTDLNK